MGRKAKFPALPQKFHKAIAALMGSEHLFSPAIATLVCDNKESFDISQEEAEELLSRASRYCAIAEEAGILRRRDQGRRGYSLIPIDERKTTVKDDCFYIPRAEGTSCDSADDDRSPGPGKLSDRAFWESLLHFPATLALSSEFDAEVLSLPVRTSGVRWGNPDMLMIREGKLELFRRQLELQNKVPIDFDRLGLVAHEPRFILSSVELKFDLRANRAKFFEAIAEASANGSWANETWLVLLEREVQTDQNASINSLDFDVTDLARRTGVGIVELGLYSNNGRIEMQLEKHTEAAYRPSLSLTSSQNGLVGDIVSLISDFEERGSYLAEDISDFSRLARLLHTARENLLKQTGFVDGYRQGTERFGVPDSPRRQELRCLLNGILHYIPNIIGQEFDNQSVENILRGGASYLTEDDNHNMRDLLSWLSKEALSLGNKSEQSWTDGSHVADGVV